jgi:hypothetical protein
MPNRLEQNRYPGDDFQSPTFHLPTPDPFAVLKSDARNPKGD